MSLLLAGIHQIIPPSGRRAGVREAVLRTGAMTETDPRDAEGHELAVAEAT
jgi:hypothetical protein